MERRTFIQKTCLGCVGILGVSAFASALQSCTPIPFIALDESSNAEIKVLESAFVEEQNVLILKNKSWDTDLLLVKKVDKKTKNISYHALKMECTHNPNPLSATKHGLSCATHGSTFDLDGEVTLQPAVKPLEKYLTEIKNKTIYIKIPS
jgi:Rieske Fe-S protein